MFEVGFIIRFRESPIGQSAQNAINRSAFKKEE
jgi:hypothetical protein